jgi:hypothetical protein
MLQLRTGSQVVRHRPAKPITVGFDSHPVLQFSWKPANPSEANPFSSNRNFASLIKAGVLWKIVSIWNC